MMPFSLSVETPLELALGRNTPNSLKMISSMISARLGSSKDVKFSLAEECSSAGGSMTCGVIAGIMIDMSVIALSVIALSGCAES